MRVTQSKFVVCFGLAVLAAGLFFTSGPLRSQPVWPFAPPLGMPPITTPDAQRAALNQVRTQIGWVQNATRTAPNYGAGGADIILQQFQILRDMYGGFTQTLNPRQAEQGANEWAELAAGLDIIGEAFGNYQNDLATGRPTAAALRDLCEVMREASQVWLQQFNRDCSRLRVGF